ncbi:unnamed protein product [Amoebophrya sp. A120]|nr:unnamed protein product [Amoebophrya sp. A120]|eukprot:GSA120T00018870001.1
MPHPPKREFIPRRPSNVRFVRFMGTRGTLCRPQMMRVEQLYLDFEDIIESQYDSIFSDGVPWDGRGFCFYTGDGRLLRPDQRLEEASSGPTIVIFWAFNRVDNDSIHYDPPQFLPPGCREKEIWEEPPDQVEEKDAHSIRRCRLARRIREQRGSKFDHEQRLKEIERRKLFDRAVKYEEYAKTLARTEKEVMANDDIMWKFEKQYPGGTIPEAERKRLLVFFGLKEPRGRAAATGTGSSRMMKIRHATDAIRGVNVDLVHDAANIRQGTTSTEAGASAVVLPAAFYPEQEITQRPTTAPVKGLRPQQGNRSTPTSNKFGATKIQQQQSLHDLNNSTRPPPQLQRPPTTGNKKSYVASTCTRLQPQSRSIKNNYAQASSTAGNGMIRNSGLLQENTQQKKFAPASRARNKR